MNSPATTYSDRTPPKALLPWLASIIAKQWKAFQAAARAARADELTWNMALQDARMMADLSRAMTETARKH